MWPVDELPDDAWGQHIRCAASDCEPRSCGAPDKTAQRTLAVTRRAVAACSSSNAKRLRVELAKVDGVALRDTAAWLGGRQHVDFSTPMMCLFLFEGRHLAADALSLLSRLAGGRDGLTCDVADRFTGQEEFLKQHRLNAMVDLLLVLAIVWRWAALCFDALFRSSNLDSSLSRPHLRGILVSMLAVAPSCPTLQAYMALCDAPCVLYSDRAAEIANAAATAAASLLQLAASCKAVYSAVSASASLLDLMTRALHIIDVRKAGNRPVTSKVAACQLAEAVNASLHSVDHAAKHGEGAAKDMAAHWSVQPDVCRVLLDALLVPGVGGDGEDSGCDGSQSAKVASASRFFTWDAITYEALLNVVASGYWTLAPARAGHIAALLTDTRLLPQLDTYSAQQGRCRLAVALLPRVLPPAAQPRAFIDVCDVILVTAQPDPGYDEDILDQIADFVVLMVQRLVEADVAPSVLFFRARCILSRGVMAAAEATVRRAWRENSRKCVPVYLPLELGVADGLWLLAVRLLSVVARDRAVAATAMGAALGAAAIMRKALCHTARAAAALRCRMVDMGPSLPRAADDEQAMSPAMPQQIEAFDVAVHVGQDAATAEKDQNASAPAWQQRIEAFDAAANSNQHAVPSELLEMLELFEPTINRLKMVIKTLPTCCDHIELGLIFSRQMALQLLPPTLHMLRLLHPLDQAAQGQLLLVLLDLLPQLLFRWLDLDSTFVDEFVNLLGEVLSAVAGQNGWLAGQQEGLAGRPAELAGQTEKLAGRQWELVGQQAGPAGEAEVERSTVAEQQGGLSRNPNLQFSPGAEQQGRQAFAPELQLSAVAGQQGVMAGQQGQPAREPELQLSAVVGRQEGLASAPELQDRVYSALLKSFYVVAPAAGEQRQPPPLLQPWLLQCVAGRPLRGHLLAVLGSAEFAEWFGRRKAGVVDMRPAVAVKELEQLLSVLQIVPSAAEAPAATGGGQSWDACALRTVVAAADAGFLGCWCRGCSNWDRRVEMELPLRTCSGCRIARYCSVPCQRRAWRAGHRAACQAHRLESGAPGPVAGGSPGPGAGGTSGLVAGGTPGPVAGGTPGPVAGGTPRLQWPGHQGAGGWDTAPCAKRFRRAGAVEDA